MARAMRLARAGRWEMLFSRVYWHRASKKYPKNPRSATLNAFPRVSHLSKFLGRLSLYEARSAEKFENVQVRKFHRCMSLPSSPLISCHVAVPQSISDTCFIVYARTIPYQITSIIVSSVTCIAEWCTLGDPPVLYETNGSECGAISTYKCGAISNSTYHESYDKVSEAMPELMWFALRLLSCDWSRGTFINSMSFRPITNQQTQWHSMQLTWVQS
jgi:hypothetical protein